MVNKRRGFQICMFCFDEEDNNLKNPFNFERETRVKTKSKPLPKSCLVKLPSRLHLIWNYGRNSRRIRPTFTKFSCSHIIFLQLWFVILATWLSHIMVVVGRTPSRLVCSLVRIKFSMSELVRNSQDLISSCSDLFEARDRCSMFVRFFELIKS